MPKGNFEPKPKGQPQLQTLKSRVVAEFVDAIPEPKNNPNKYRTSWEPQDGFKEGLMKAFNNPGRAMLLVTYDQKSDPPSKRRQLARFRAESLEKQGYTERTGWTVKAVDHQVYVLYQPVEC